MTIQFTFYNCLTASTFVIKTMTKFEFLCEFIHTVSKWEIRQWLDKSNNGLIEIKNPYERLNYYSGLIK